SALDVRDVKALDSPRQLGQAERVLQRFLRGFGRGLHHAKTLIERLFGVLCRQVDERALLAALGNQDFHFTPALVAEQLLQDRAVFEIHRRQDAAWNILLIDVDLLEQGGKEFSRIE